MKDSKENSTLYSDTIKMKNSTYFNEKSPQQKIEEVCDNLKKLLVEKNKKYGNSALNPVRIFSNSDSNEQLLVRIDDKLNRIMNMKNCQDSAKDTIIDLIGYLVLLVVNKKWDSTILEGLKDS